MTHSKLLRLTYLTPLLTHGLAILLSVAVTLTALQLLPQYLLPSYISKRPDLVATSPIQQRRAQQQSLRQIKEIL